MTNILTLPKKCSEIAFEIAREFRDDAIASSRNIVSRLEGRNFYCVTENREIRPYSVEGDATCAPGCILPVKEGRLVASLDSTAVLLGISDAGPVYAGRVSVTFATQGNVSFYSRIGPIFTHYGSFDEGLEQLEGLLRRNLEERTANAVLNSGFDGILLLDGSLKHPDSIRIKYTGYSEVVAISKTSSLLPSGYESTLYSAKKPSYVMINEGKIKSIVARLTTDGIPFRIDILSNRTVENVLGQLVYNDSFYAGISRVSKNITSPFCIQQS